MGNGISLHIGLNRVSSDRHPDGRYESLFGCDIAALAMAEIARLRGFNPTVWCDPRSVTLRAATSWLGSAADGKNRARSGDIVLVTFAGHGDQVRDADYDEARDQALVFYDSLLVDDEIYEILERFEEGVRVVFVVDCCYGGSVVSNLGSVVAAAPARGAAGCASVGATAPTAPAHVATLPRPSDSGFAFARPRVRANVLLLSACDEASPVKGAQRPGALPPFTERLVGVWTRCGGTFPGGYLQLETDIGKPAVLFRRLLNDPAMLSQQPFAI